MIFYEISILKQIDLLGIVNACTIINIMSIRPEGTQKLFNLQIVIWLSF